MRIAYTTVFNAQDVHRWSGTPFYMSKYLAESGVDVAYFGSLTRSLPPFFKLRQIYSKYIKAQRESPRFNIHAAKHYSAEMRTRLAHTQFDAILSPQINPIAYLDTDQPMYLWTDAVYAALVGFYPPFSAHSKQTIMQGNTITQACLSRCRLAIFSSHWAAQSARELYQIAENKIAVVPYGANINDYPSAEEVATAIQKRKFDKLKLLFLAKSWERKGGDIVLAVAKALHAANIPVELSIMGHLPKHLEPLPDYVKPLGFVSKQTAAGRQQFKDILLNSHFLFVPSRAEAYGIVFCEANSHGIPCVTTNVGGIETIIKDNVNGMKFAAHTPIEAYCHYFSNIMHAKKSYQALAHAAYNEFITRLNWPVAIKNVKALIEATL